MSLIQEALKRRRQDDGDGLTSEKPPAAPAPPPTARRSVPGDLQREEKPAPPSRRGRHLVVLAAGILGVVLVLGAVVVISVVIVAKMFVQSTAHQVPETIAPPAAPPVEAAQPPPVVAEARTGSAEREGYAPAGTSGEDLAAVTIERPGAGSEEPLAAVVIDAAPSGPKPAAVEPVEPPAVDVLAEGQWPAVLLGGVVALSDSAMSSAIINDNLVFIGEDIQGVRLLEVSETGILLQYQGEEKFLRVGQGTR